VQVAIEVGALSVQALARLVGELSHLEQVGVPKERHPVVEHKGLARMDLRLDFLEAHDHPRSLATMLAGRHARASPRHPKADAAGPL